MATTINVSTWTELASALSTNIADEYQIDIHLTNNIDCNRDIPEGTTGVTLMEGLSNTTWRYVNVYGHGYEIRNLRNNIINPGNIFNMVISGENYSRRIRYTFYDIDWRNLLILGNHHFVYQIAPAVGTGTDCQQFYFTRCRFVGRREAQLTSGEDWADYTTRFQSCFINVQNTKSDLSADHNRRRLTQFHSYAYYSWIRENWYVAGVPSTTPTYGTTTFACSGCYIDGEFVSAKGFPCTITSDNQYDATMQNVVDAKLTRINDIGSTFAINAPKGIFRDLVTDRNDSTIVYTNFTHNSYSIPATPAEMTDPQALYDKGFDIIVPD